MVKQAGLPKRAKQPLRVDKTREFEDDWNRLNNTGRFNMHAVREVMTELFLDNELSAEYKDHSLKGEWDGYRECHVRGDFLLIYKRSKRDLIFVRLGTHAELFE